MSARPPRPIRAVVDGSGMGVMELVLIKLLTSDWLSAASKTQASSILPIVPAPCPASPVPNALSVKLLLIVSAPFVVKVPDE